jgi:hypothetical protein
MLMMNNAEALCHKSGSNTCRKISVVGLLHVKQYLSNARLNATGIAFFHGEVYVTNVCCYPMEASGY